MFGLFRLSYLFYPWGMILQLVALVHFVRRRPQGFWLWVIFLGGFLGALVYLVAEMLPDAGLLRNAYRGYGRKSRISVVETAILDNPSAANYEELGELLMENGKLQPAREAFDKAIAARSNTLETFYHRGVCAILLGDAPAALPDLERAVSKDPHLDFNRASGLLAQAYALTGQPDKAEALFRQVTVVSTLSETYLNFADFLASQGRPAEAREWAQKVLDKEPTMPRYLRRRERPWSQRARKILKQLPA